MGFGEFGDQMFVAEWGDLTPPTDPTFMEPAGYQVSRIVPETGEAVPFVRNQSPGPASGQDAAGRGIERPFDVKFGPDGAMYIVDYGIVTIDMSLIEAGQPPYAYDAGTGSIWKVTAP